ncbi:hypothetical protein B0H16DRAFT_1581446 [Mycena metata]|uniref:Uncharacterized protein n=1 Tax=Mycena metata TaxID=1033252 RepID=A0AAD7MTL3_9AGAR|nr:hypothetical protein B0H16DRAFT_1581446 [Mycena metata]
MTVAVYQGKGAEEDWRKDISRNSCLRHPNFIQLCGLTTSSLMHAIIFHDDLIPLGSLLNLYQKSRTLTIYCITECTFWIRRSTGELCADLISSNISHRIQTPQPDSHEISSSPPSIERGMAVDSLSVQKYHEIFYWDVSQVRHIHKSTQTTVNLGGLISWPLSDHFELPLALASLSHVEVPPHSWYIAQGLLGFKGGGEVTGSGWTRWKAGDIMNRTLRIHIWHWNPECWLSQANHIFDRLKLNGNFGDLVIVDDITFEIPIQAVPEGYLFLPAPSSLGTGVTLPEGYLFVCPVDDLRVGPCSFRWPDRPVYWSIDPSGSRPLGMEEATGLGFPPLQFNTIIRGKCWDHTAYTDLRRFHLAKGFDPTSQDIARHLGDPLYHLTQQSAHDDCYLLATGVGPEAGKYNTAGQGTTTPTLLLWARKLQPPR